MNRLAVILFAVAVLLAHSLGIHQTGGGDYAAPYDFAHVAYRVARNLVREGTLAWNPGGPVVESYPSPSWVLVAAVAERLTIGPNQLTQWLGTLCALGSMVVLAQFSTKRLAGLIAPLLLAASGAAAAAGGSGTEVGLAMLLVTTAAFASETGRGGLFGLAGALLLWTRKEGALFLAAWFVLELLDRPRTDGARRRALRGGFSAVLVAFIVLLFLRRFATGGWISPFEQQLLRCDGHQIGLGIGYLEGYLLCSGSGLLVLVPCASLCLGLLPARGRRALVLALVWALVVAANGGDPLPFWNALVPVLPLVFLAIQEAIAAWLDRTPAHTALASLLLVASVTASFLVSRLPTDIGPLPLEAWHRAWMEPEPSLRAAYGRSLGRLGLAEEIRDVERLRVLGVYLRDRTAEPSTLLTFWPGAIGYLSRRTVYDMLGRATPLPGESRPRAWAGDDRVDLVAAFRRQADYAAPILGRLGEGQSPADMLHEWLERHDVAGDVDDRLFSLLEALGGYELVAVPVPLDSRQPRVTSQVPFLILRSRDKQEAPTLSLRPAGGGFEVVVHHHGNQQVADLTILARRADGRTWTMRPTGEFVPERVVARANLLLYPTGSLPIRLATGRVPAGLDALELVAQLHNPGTSIDVPLAAVGSPAALELEPSPPR